MSSSFLSPFGEDLIAAMSYFFILSGFILVVSTSKNGFLPKKINSFDFWKRRAARILPVYVFALVVFFAINFDYDPSIPLNGQIRTYCYSLVLLQSWKYNMALDVNYPAWSLSVEAFFYFIFPLIYSLMRNLSNKKLLIFSAVAWILNAYIFIRLTNANFPENFVKFFPMLHVATFLTGMCFGILFIRNYSWLESEGKRQIHFATIFTTLFIFYSSYKNYEFYNYQHNGLLSPYYILVIYSLSLLKGKFGNLLSTKPLIFLGSISYSLYILQFPIYQICQKYLPWFKNQTKEDMLYPYLIVLICVSSLTYLFIEKPARKYLTKRKTVA